VLHLIDVEPLELAHGCLRGNRVAEMADGGVVADVGEPTRGAAVVGDLLAPVLHAAVAVDAGVRQVGIGCSVGRVLEQQLALSGITGLRAARCGPQGQASKRRSDNQPAGRDSFEKIHEWKDATAPQSFRMFAFHRACSRACERGCYAVCGHSANDLTSPHGVGPWQCAVFGMRERRAALRPVTPGCVCLRAVACIQRDCRCFRGLLGKNKGGVDKLPGCLRPLGPGIAKRRKP
jgi:hypothetical protein